MRLRLPTSIFCAALAGCVGTATGGPTTFTSVQPAAGVDRSTAGDPSATYGQLLVHGNFCGPGYPELQSAGGPAAAMIAEMRTITPIDRVDTACYGHDVCYVETATQQTCDETFIAELETIRSGRARGLAAPSGDCVLLIDSMLAAFYGKTAAEREDSTQQAAGGAMTAISAVNVARNTNLQRGGTTELIEQSSRYLKGLLGVSDKRPLC